MLGIVVLYFAVVVFFVVLFGYLWGPDYIDDKDILWILWACLFWPLSTLVVVCALMTRALTSYGQYLARKKD